MVGVCMSSRQDAVRLPDLVSNLRGLSGVCEGGSSVRSGKLSAPGLTLNACFCLC
jgi:hypothetical protein